MYSFVAAQAANAALSSEHWNVTPGSSAASRNVADVLAVTGSGPASIDVCGATPGGSGWCVQERRAGVGSALPAWSIARTSNTCAPVDRLL